MYDFIRALSVLRSAWDRRKGGCSYAPRDFTFEYATTLISVFRYDVIR